LKFEVGTGDEDFDHQARFVQAEFSDYFLIGVYMMNAGQKLENLERRHQLEDLMLGKLKAIKQP
jgi:exonuclease III